MKRWQAISLNLLIVGATAATGEVKNPMLKAAALAMLASVAGKAADNSSKTNPDGSPAQTAWEPKK